MRLRGLGALALLALASAASAAPARPPITGVSHLSVYAADPAKAEHFYVHDLGAVKSTDPENPRGTRYHFSPTQFVEVLPLAQGQTSINRLDHAAFTTTDAEGLRAYLASKKISVPARVEQGADGSRWFQVTDPEGMRIEFVQSPARLPQVAVNPLSSRMIHVGFIVHDRARQDAFYKDVLGFRPYWAGGMHEDRPTWVSLQVPDGRDWLEYMIVGTPEGRGIPADMNQATLGVLNHFALGVQDVRTTYTTLWNEDRIHEQKGLPQIGRDAKWQLNLLDPDGTRAEFMEFKAIGKPCCSPFMAPDPAP